jgi:hypothetical protein
MHCKNCGALIPQSMKFCGECGAKAEIKIEVVKKGFFGRRKTETAVAEVVHPGELPDIKQLLPQMQNPQNKSPIVEALERIEKKLDSLISNNNWLLMNVDNWVQGYKQNAEESEIEKNK